MGHGCATHRSVVRAVGILLRLGLGWHKIHRRLLGRDRSHRRRYRSRRSRELGLYYLLVSSPYVGYRYQNSNQLIVIKRRTKSTKSSLMALLLGGDTVVAPVVASSWSSIKFSTTFLTGVANDGSLVGGSGPGVDITFLCSVIGLSVEFLSCGMIRATLEMIKPSYLGTTSCGEAKSIHTRSIQFKFKGSILCTSDVCHASHYHKFLRMKF